MLLFSQFIFMNFTPTIPLMHKKVKLAKNANEDIQVTLEIH